MVDYDGESLKVTVSKGSNGNFGIYYRGEIEEDVWHEAVLTSIKVGTKSFKGKEFPAWVWIYELQDKQFNVKTDEGIKKAQIIEKTSQKFTGKPRMSNAYIRYTQLTGEELKPGANVDLKSLFGIQCKLMIKNTDSGKEDNDGNTIVYHNIEKISIKGVEKSKKELEEEFEEDTKKNIASAEKESKVKKKNKVTDDGVDEDADDDIFSDLDL